MTKKKLPAGHPSAMFTNLPNFLPIPPASLVSIRPGGIFAKFLESLMSDPEILERSLDALRKQTLVDNIHYPIDASDWQVVCGPPCPPNCPHCIKLQKQMVEAEIRRLKAELVKKSQKEHTDGTPEAESGD